MPSLLVRLVAVLALWGWCFAALPARAQATPPITLSAEQPSFTVSGQVLSWLELGNGAEIDQVATRADLFSPAPALQREPLQTGHTLWLRLDLVRPRDAPAQWTLNIPLPFVDEARLYQRDASGSWHFQRAGDTLAQSEWSQRGLYPDFTLDLPDNAVHTVYLRLNNFKHISVPIRLATQAQRETQRSTELLALGLLAGVLLLLTTLSIVRLVEHGSRPDAVAAVFGLLVTLATAQANGVLNLLLWPQWPVIGDYAYSMLPVLAIGTSLLFVRMLYAISTPFHRYDVFLRGIGIATIVSTLTYFIDRTAADKVGVALLLVATTTGLVATFLSWRGQSPIWPWLLAAYVPQYLGLLRIVVEALGLLPTWWEMRYWLSVAVALSVPVLLYALSLATHDRKELYMRARHLPTQDALTGLLTREAFLAELTQAYDRAIHAREPMAVVVVRVVNYEHIRKGLGDQVAENSLLRAVVKLHRILRDMDPAGRVGSGEFGLILDGVLTRQALTERMVQLIGSGLIPLPGLHPPITLQFQAACVLLHENPLPPTEALQALQELLGGMSTHTRRPIRFLEPAQTQPVPLAPPSSLP